MQPVAACAIATITPDQALGWSVVILVHTFLLLVPMLSGLGIGLMLVHFRQEARRELVRPV